MLNLLDAEAKVGFGSPDGREIVFARTTPQIYSIAKAERVK